MRIDFSPTREAARRLAARGTPLKAALDGVPAGEVRSCEWPRRNPLPVARTGIWRALREIQLRHA